MSKILVGVLIGVTLMGAILGVFGVVHAQAPTTPAQQNGQIGPGMMGGRGASRMGWALEGDQTGPLHDLMMAAWADKLDLSAAEIEQSLADGETMYEIATAQGLSSEEFQAAWTEIRTTVLDQAVAQGLISQEQADWMKSRGNRVKASGCLGGAGRGRWGNAGQTNP